MCTDLEARHKTVFVYRHHDYLCRETKRIKKTFGTNDEFIASSHDTRQICKS